MKVFTAYPAWDKPKDYFADCDTLRAQIATLAASEKDAVWLMKIAKTERNSELGGLGGVSFECTDAFAAKVKALPLVKNLNDGGSGYDLERDRQLNPPAKPATTRAPKP